LDGSLLDLALNLPITQQLPYRGFPIELDCFMFCGPRKIESIGLPSVPVQGLSM